MITDLHFGFTVSAADGSTTLRVSANEGYASVVDNVGIPSDMLDQINALLDSLLTRPVLQPRTKMVRDEAARKIRERIKSIEEASAKLPLLKKQLEQLRGS